MSKVLQLVATTTEQHLKEVADTTVRNHPVFALLQQRGRIEKNARGRYLQWPVKMGLPQARAFTDAYIDYSQSDKYRPAQLEWKGLYATDSMTEKERLQNKGDAAILDRYAEIVPDLQESLVEQFSMSLYADGSTTDLLDGLETMFAVGGTTVAADKVAIPSGTYAGLSTAPGTTSAVWSASLPTKPNAAFGYDWPAGNGMREFDFWSPRCINWSSTSWVDSSHTTFKDTGEYVIRQAIQWTIAAQGQPGRADLCVLSPELYTELTNGLVSRQRIIAPAKRLLDLGFPEGFALDGVEVTSDFAVPARTGYLLNTDKISLMSLTSDLFASRGPEWDPRTASYLFLVYYFGNFRFKSPKFFAKLYNYA